LLVADIDGSDERTIFETSKTITDNVFSPDGKRIAFASGQSDTGEQDFGVYTVNVESGEVKAATDFKWVHVRGVVWLPDQSGLLVTASDQGGEPLMLWQISLPGGEVKRILDSQPGITTLSGTRNMGQILLTKVSPVSSLYLAPYSTPDNLQPLADASGGLDWAPDGSLIFCSASSGNQDVWRLSADGISQKQLTTEDSIDFDPTVSPDGRYVVFVSSRGENTICGASMPMGASLSLSQMGTVNNNPFSRRMAGLSFLAQ
jgi:Tol biopolymer transport system component